ncbi:MBL fold metallo-hydrolase [Saccharothrix variisporea]|uniref:MBL fold metallo-hydrolase n=1 Tax=Saccharothrix variisporea TaxID=543527 RepID=UPI0014772F14|nr:MBL fold metallo-hydrolase [Saccharothrix variisporea]
MNRRQVLVGSAAALAGSALAGSAMPASAVQASAVPEFAEGRSGVRMRWLGVAGWELTFAGRRVVIDPYLTRLPVFDQAGKFIENHPLRVRTDLVDRHLAEKPELVLVTHGHYDHMLEAPYLVQKHGSRVIGSETHRNLLLAQGVPKANVTLAGGGEHLDFHGFTVQVFRSLHSVFKDYSTFAPGTLTGVPQRPETISDLVEGGTLAYLVDVGGFSVLFLSGAANFVEREVAGLRPDVLVLAMSGHANVFDYTARALRATRPRVVVPSHHDDMVTQLDDPALPPRGNPAAAAELAETAKRLGLATRVLDPEVLRWYEF